MDQERIRKYSGLFIITPEKEDVFDEVKQKIASTITEDSGKILNENMIGKRQFAYLIKKFKEGVYYEVEFEALPEDLAKMKKVFRIDTDILRTLIDRV